VEKPLQLIGYVTVDPALVRKCEMVERQIAKGSGTTPGTSKIGWRIEA
jgi:hypothetical protein